MTRPSSPHSSISERLRHVAAAHGHHFTGVHEPSWWLRSRLVDLQARDRAGQLLPCPHLWPGAPAMVALWAPDRAACSTCAPTLVVTGEADRTCDRCAVVADQVAPALVGASPTLVVVFGLCAACFDREAGQ